MLISASPTDFTISDTTPGGRSTFPFFKMTDQLSNHVLGYQAI